MEIQQIKKYYEQEKPEQDRLYDFTRASSYYYDRKRMALVLKITREFMGRSLLDVGCGDGTMLNHIDCEEIVGLDISRAKIRLCVPNERLSQRGSFFEANAEHLPFKDDSFDLVLASEVIEHVTDPIRMVREIARVSREIVVVSTPTQSTLWRLLFSRIFGRRKCGPTHIREFSQRELLLTLEKNGLKPLKVQAAPLLEFPFMYLFFNPNSKSLMIPRIVSFLDSIIEKIFPFLRRYGFVTCVVCTKRGV